MVVGRLKQIFIFLIFSNILTAQTQVIPNAGGGGAVGGSGNLTTAGNVPYVGSAGILNIDIGNFYWDATNHRLGIGTNAPTSAATVARSSVEVSPSLASTILQLRGYSSSGKYSGIGFNYIDASGSQIAPVWVGVKGNAYTTNTNADFLIATRANETNADPIPRLYITAAGATGIGTSNTSPTGTLSVLDRTATTGATSLLVGSDGTNTSATTTQVVVKAGAGQSSTNLQEWQNNAGSVIAWLDSTGSLNTLTAAFFAGGGYRVANNATVTFSNGTNFTNTSLSRISDGVVGVGTGAAGSVAGTLQAKSVAIISPTIPSTAADACTAGTISWDANYIYLCTASGAWKRVAVSTW